LISLNLIVGPYLVVFDDEDYELISNYKWFPAKNYYTVYAIAHGPTINGKRETIRMHRLILGATKDKLVDHKNRNGLDNRKENLRLCTATQNKYNQRAYTGSISEYKGVTFDKETIKWRARISVENKRLHLGRFSSEKEAAEAYNKAAVEYFGEFALLNEVN
jgi:type V secretory pathway adhesin AidA